MTGTQKIEELEKEYSNLFEIDANLDRLVRRIELLSYVNPINIEKEKHRFFTSKFTAEPNFKYPKLKFDPYKLHRLFFSQRLERIKDVRIRQLYQEVIYHYSNMIQCIETIGKSKRFYYNSLRVYGTPMERDVQNARYILHFEDEPASVAMEKKYSADEARAYFEEFSHQYRFPLNIKFSTHIAAEAMVSNSSQALLIRKNIK